MNHNKRRRALHREQFGRQAELCRRLPCAATNEPPPSDPHHVVPRSRGGRDEHTVPLSRAAHIELHTIGAASFERKYGVNLVQVAAELQARFTTNQ